MRTRLVALSILFASNVLACGSASDVTASPTTTSDDAGLSPDASARERASHERRVDPEKRVDTERRYIPTKAVTERRVPLETAPATYMTLPGDAGAP